MNHCPVVRLYKTIGTGAAIKDSASCLRRRSYQMKPRRQRFEAGYFPGNINRKLVIPVFISSLP